MRAGRSILHRSLTLTGNLLAGFIAISCDRSQPPPPFAWATGQAEITPIQRQKEPTGALATATESEVLKSPSEQVDDQFGAALALTLNTLVVGAPNTEGGGAAWVFDLADVKAPPIRLTPPRLPGGCAFGTSVAISDSGRFIAVGAPLTKVERDENAGAVHLWERKDNGWIYVGSFTGEDTPANALLGSSVAVGDDTLLAGAPFETIDTTAAHGAVATWMRDPDGTWNENVTLQPDPTISNARFGGAMSLKGTWMIVGACYGRAENLAEGGIAYIYQRRRTGWPRNPLVQIMATGKLKFEGWRNIIYERGPGDHFGWAVSILGDLALVGSPNSDEGSFMGSGSVHVFLRDSGTWSQVQYISALDKKTGDAFGSAVGIAGTLFAIGAPLKSVGDKEDAGATYVYQLEHGVNSTVEGFMVQLVASQPRAGGRMGAMLACTPEIIAVSEPGPADLSAPGQIYIFRRNEDAWGVPAAFPTPIGTVPGQEEASSSGGGSSL